MTDLELEQMHQEQQLEQRQDKEAYTEYTEGFSRRLTMMLDSLGFRDHGRLTVLAKWMDFTPGGVKLCLDNDRPPKQEKAMDALVAALLTNIKTKYPTLATDEVALKRYLLNGGVNPLPKGRVEQADDHDVDPITKGRIFLRLDEVAKNMGIQRVFDELDDAQILKAYYKVVGLVKENRMDLESDGATRTLEALIELAQKNLL